MKRDPDNPTGKYILGPDHEVLACPDLMKWAEWTENAYKTGELRVAETTVGKVWVSTVFLGLDHNFLGDGPPILFETMMFPVKDDGTYGDAKDEMHRYATWDDAEAGHNAVVKRLQKRLEKGVGEKVGDLPVSDRSAP